MHLPVMRVLGNGTPRLSVTRLRFNTPLHDRLLLGLGGRTVREGGRTVREGGRTVREGGREGGREEGQ